MKRLFISAVLLLIKTVCLSQSYIGWTDKKVYEKFLNIEMHSTKVGDSMAICVIDTGYKAVLWYDRSLGFVTSYQVNPTNSDMCMGIEIGLNKACIIMSTGRVWLCQRDKYTIEVEKNFIETFDFRRVK